MFSVISMNDSLRSPNMKKQQICNIHEPAGHSEEQTVKCLMSHFANSSSSTRLNISPSCSYRKRQRNVCNSLIPFTSISSPCHTANTSDQIWLIIFIIRPNRTTNPWSDHRSQPVTDRLQRKFGWWLRMLTQNTVTISSSPELTSEWQEWKEHQFLCAVLTSAASQRGANAAKGEMSQQHRVNERHTTKTKYVVRVLQSFSSEEALRFTHIQREITPTTQIFTK